MCVYVEDIFLGSKRASRVEDKAAGRGDGVVLHQPLFLLCEMLLPLVILVTKLHGLCNGPHDLHVAALLFILQCDTVSR